LAAQKFKAPIDIIGINPFVFVPQKILLLIFEKAGRNKGPIPVKGTVNKKPYKQTLIRHSGHWRLYINLSMLPNSPKRIGESIEVSIAFDPVKRETPFHPALKAALEKNKNAKQVFESLRPSRQTEINKYLSQLKTEQSNEKNVKRTIGYLLEQNSFVGDYRGGSESVSAT
jgi:hypothetical protein